jgi:hypothetical protein
MHTYNCEMSLALTYSLRRPKLARKCARKALLAAISEGRADLAFQANTLLGVI